MEWYWCSDWDCVATWMWDPATAAWVQAVGSLLALLVAVGVAIYSVRSHAKREEGSRHATVVSNTVKVGRFQALGCGFVAGIPIDGEPEQDSVPFPRLGITIGQIHRVVSALDQLLIQESAHPQVSTVAAMYIVGAEQVIAILRDMIDQVEGMASGQRLVDKDVHLPPNTRKALQEQDRMMSAVCEATVQFASSLKDDSEAAFPQLDLPEAADAPAADVGNGDRPGSSGE